MNRIAAQFALGMSLVVASSGCYSTWDIPPQSLPQLNGFHEPEKRPIMTADGDTMIFDRSTELRLADTAGGVTAAKFSSIEVNGPTLTGTARPANQPIAVDLRQIVNVQAKKFSGVKTGLAIGIPIGVVTLLTVVLFVIVIGAAAGVGACAGC